MTDTAELNREELYKKWYEWVTGNLGRDADRASIAARAATNAVVEGAGFNAAATVARAAWFETTNTSEGTSAGRAADRRTSGLRIAATVLGIVGCLLGATVGLPFAFLAFTLSGSDHAQDAAPVTAASLAVISAGAGLLGSATAIWKPILAALSLALAGLAMAGYGAMWAASGGIGLDQGVAGVAITAAILLLSAAAASFVSARPGTSKKA